MPRQGSLMEVEQASRVGAAATSRHLRRSREPQPVSPQGLVLRGAPFGAYSTGSSSRKDHNVAPHSTPILQVLSAFQAGGTDSNSVGGTTPFSCRDVLRCGAGLARRCPGGLEVDVSGTRNDPGVVDTPGPLAGPAAASGVQGQRSSIALVDSGRSTHRVFGMQCAPPRLTGPAATATHRPREEGDDEHGRGRTDGDPSGSRQRAARSGLHKIDRPALSRGPTSDPLIQGLRRHLRGFARGASRGQPPADARRGAAHGLRNSGGQHNDEQ